MTRAYFAALITSMVIGAASWQPHPDHVPPWYQEMCAEVTCP
jgi:hypothetical protein